MSNPLIGVSLSDEVFARVTADADGRQVSRGWVISEIVAAHYGLPVGVRRRTTKGGFGTVAAYKAMIGATPEQLAAIETIMKNGAE